MMNRRKKRPWLSQRQEGHRPLRYINGHHAVRADKKGKFNIKRTAIMSARMEAISNIDLFKWCASVES